MGTASPDRIQQPGSLEAGKGRLLSVRTQEPPGGPLSSCTAIMARPQLPQIHPYQLDWTPSNTQETRLLQAGPHIMAQPWAVCHQVLGPPAHGDKRATCSIALVLGFGFPPALTQLCLAKFPMRSADLPQVNTAGRSMC